ncbi:MAG TPA: nuclear transport factor 2 family protein [Acidimicrobiales bacterium]|nr:nuclear transport factor 2 family protein [Acidimicrobiales bacterium]
MGASENKAAVEAGYAAFGQGDIASVIAMNAPDAVWHNYSSTASPLQGEHKGLDGIAALFGLIGDNIEFTQFEIAPIAAEGDTVVAAGQQTYTVKRTGKTVSGPVVHVFTFGADGKVVRFEEWESNAEGAWT